MHSLSNPAESFDIADLKRASVKMKGALQAEWQDEISHRGQTDGAVDLIALDLYDDQSRIFLPRIDLTLKMNSNFKSVNYVPTLSSLQGHEEAHLARYTISLMSC